MLEGVSTSTSVAQLKREGIGFLFRGIGPPLCIKGIASGVMFSAKAHFTTTLKRIFPGGSPQGISLGASVLSGLSEGLCCAPLERVQTLLMVNTIRSLRFKSKIKIRVIKVKIKIIWPGRKSLNIDIIGLFAG